MNRIALALASLLFVATTAVGDDNPTLVVLDGKLVKVDRVVDPVISLDTAAAVELGEIVIVEAKISGEATEFVKRKDFTWDVTERGFKKQSWGDGQKVVFGAGMKKATIKVAIRANLTYQVGNDQIVKTITTSKDLEVGQNSPDPEPDPIVPPPGPGPVVPDPVVPPVPDPSLTGEAKMARDWAIANVKLNKTDLALSARVMATSFRQIAARIPHDTEMNTARKILMETKTSNNTALQTVAIDPNSWNGWGTDLQNYLYQQYQNKQLVTPDQYKQVWNQIAIGLDSIK